jgi:hypothetical protein
MLGEFRIVFAAAWIGKTPGFHLKAVGAATAFSDQQRLFSFDQAGPDDIDNDLLPFAEAHKPGSLKNRDVNEHVLSATVEGNEAVAPLGIEPFHCAGLLDGYARR